MREFGVADFSWMRRGHIKLMPQTVQCGNAAAGSGGTHARVEPYSTAASPRLRKEKRMRHSWFRHLFLQLAGSTRKSAPRPRRYRPMTEWLEDRAVPSVAAGTPWTPFGQSPEPSIIITIGKKNDVTMTNTGFGPFDGIEDTYVGV